MAVNLATLRHEPHRKRPHLVTINIDGQRRTKAFPTKTAATKYQTKLNSAVAKGEEFDPATGEPAAWSIAAQQNATVTAIAARIVAEKWAGLRAKSRRDTVEALAHAIAATTPTAARRDRAATYRLACHALIPHAQLTLTDQDAWRSIQHISPPAGKIDYAAAEQIVSTNLNGQPAVATTRRKRIQALDLVIETATGVRPTKRRTRGTRNATTPQVSPARIGTIPEALTIINSIPLLGVRRALLLMLYSGTRPSEAIALRWERVDLHGGNLIIADNLPTAGTAYTDSGNNADLQPPKWRPSGTARTVPILAPLLPHLHQWLQEDGGEQEGLVCTTTTGTPIPTNDLANEWRPQRATIGAGWAPERLKRPYDLRHLHASTILNSGVPIPEAAARLGHSEAELLRTYAATIDADQARWTAVMSAAFTLS